MNLSKTLLAGALSVAASISFGSARAASSVQLFTSLSPVRIPYIDGTPGYEEYSPSFDAYEANVIQGLENGGVATGIQGTPSAFTPTGQTNFSYVDTLGTSFHSWAGNTNPTGAYSGEYGTYVRTSGLVTSSQAFTLNDVYQSYSDPYGPVPADSFADIEGGKFGGDVFGLSYGADGVKGGGDDVFYGAANPGSATTPINELYYFGYAQENAFCPQVCAASYPSNHAAVDDYGAYIATIQPFDFSETLTLAPGGVTKASATFNGTISVPEPAAWALMLLGVGVVRGAVRGRKTLIAIAA